MSEAGASAAQTLASNSKVVGIDVLDSAANVQTNFTGLSGNAKLTGINLSDAGSSMTLSQAQVLSGTTTLAKVKDLYSLNVTGVSMANVASLMSTLPIATLAVSDTSDAVGMATFDTNRSSNRDQTELPKNLGESLTYKALMLKIFDIAGYK